MPQSAFLQANSLSKLDGIRHAFFTRAGGVSQGVYTSLNGGIGSQDDPVHVAENRSRMAAALGGQVHRHAHVLQARSAPVFLARTHVKHANRLVGHRELLDQHRLDRISR